MSINERPYMSFAIRSSASRQPYSYPYYHCSTLDITFKMESSVKHLQLIFGRKRNNRSTCHLFSQDADITSRSVSNRSTSTSKLGVWSLLKVPVRWFLAHRSIVWWLSLICHDCFVSLWFAVRLCVIQLYAHALCQQNIAGPLVLNIMTSNRFHNICPAWDGVWQSSNVFNEGQAFPLSWFSYHLVELI